MTLFEVKRIFRFSKSKSLNRDAVMKGMNPHPTWKK